MSIAEIAAQSAMLTYLALCAFVIVVGLAFLFEEAFFPIVGCCAILWASIFAVQISLRPPTDPKCETSIQIGKLPLSYAERYPDSCASATTASGKDQP